MHSALKSPILKACCNYKGGGGYDKSDVGWLVQMIPLRNNQVAHWQGQVGRYDSSPDIICA